MEPRDYAARVEFATWFLSLPKDTENYFIFSDEASPNLNPLIYLHIKTTAYNPLPNTIDEFKANIVQECNKLYLKELIN